jgi:hypothetical protein
MTLAHLSLAVWLFLAAGAASAGRAHEHGIARVDVATDPARLSLTLDTPLDNLVGFERAPRTDAERQRVEAALGVLRQAGGWVSIDPAAGCTLAGVELSSAVLGLGPAPGAEKAGGGTAAKGGEAHADLEVTVDFSCSGGKPAGFVDLTLFQAFPRLQRIEVQTVTPKGQMKATLRRPAGRIALTR